MISSKSSHFILLLLLFLGGTITAQEGNFNRFSVELTAGIHVPMTPSNGISRSKYIAFKQFQLAGRYMFSDKFGLKAHYAYNGFADPDNSENGLSFNRIGLEGVANIGKLLNVDYSIREKIGLLIHTGFGMTSSKASPENKIENTGNFLIGLTGEIKLNDDFSLLGDMTYVANFNQKYAYNGVPLPNNKPQSGSFVNVSIGIMYSLGNKRTHADWY